MAEVLRGLVGPTGSAGACFQNQWSFVFTFVAWRTLGQAPNVSELSCELPVDKSQLADLMKQVRPYDIVEIDIDPAISARRTRIKSLRATGVEDSELKAIAVDLQKPIFATHPLIGQLEYERKYGWYAGQAKWLDRNIEVNVSSPDASNTEIMFELVTRIFGSQQEWMQRVHSYLTEKLLPLKNDTWLQDDEEEYSPQDFLKHIDLRSIGFSESGRVTFWFSDGDLFGGHDIEVRADEKRGITEAGLAG